MESFTGLKYDSSKGRFSSWLATITINTVKSAQLKKSRQAARDHKAYTQSDDKDVCDIEDIIEREWAAFLTQKAWESISGSLSDTMRICFEKIMDGEKIKDIANELEIPENRVSVYKKRIRTVMKREIHRLREELELF